MNKNQPINFLNNHFIYINKREYFKGQKEYIALPAKIKTLVSNATIWNAIKEVYIPISQMAASICNIQYCNSLSEEDKIAFYDIETDTQENFMLGYVNEMKFTDAALMVQEMRRYDILVSFNGFKFDNAILARYSPKDFIEIKNADFTTKQLVGVVMLDL